MLLGRSCRQHCTHLIGGIAEWVLQARRASRSRHTGKDRILGCKMHMRFAFIDGRYLVLRSMNWTSAGRGQYSLLINARGLARQFGRYYEAIWHSIPRKWQEAGAHPDPESLEYGPSCTDGVDNDFDDGAVERDPGCSASPPPRRHSIRLYASNPSRKSGVGTRSYAQRYAKPAGLSESPGEPQPAATHCQPAILRSVVAIH